MSEKTSLKIMKCPTCGASLKAENSVDAIICLYCGNSVVPVMDAAPARNEAPAVGGTVIKVEGIKTSSSALAYIEHFFDEYDWDEFVYERALSDVQIDKLVASLKISSADDKNTWIADFKSIAIPYSNKVSACKSVLQSVIEEYKSDSLDAYSKLDTYKRIVDVVAKAKADILTKLEKSVANAAKYGADNAEITEMNEKIGAIRNTPAPLSFDSIDDIPEIAEYKTQKNQQIAAALAEKGINADAVYANAKAFLESSRYTEALNSYLSLNGYLDSEKEAEKIDKYFLFDDFLEVCGKIYYFKTDLKTGLLSLVASENGNLAKKPIIKGIKSIVTNHADTIYYLDAGYKLKRFNLVTLKDEVVHNKAVNAESLHIHNRKIYCLAHASKGGDFERFDLIELNLIASTVRVILSGVKSIISMVDEKLACVVYKDSKVKSEKNVLNLNILNVDTMKYISFENINIKIEGYVNDFVVYSSFAPNEKNKNLYLRSLVDNTPSVLIEKNIYKFCDIIEDKLFYYVGNSVNNALININCDKTERREWPLYISKLLFARGNWVYFIRRAGHNSVLCRSRMDGSGFSIIAADIDEFIELKNGYLYYLDNDASLIRVRMDGTNYSKLCDNVLRVLAVTDERIIFVSRDDSLRIPGKIIGARSVSSIYAVDYFGCGIMKLAYDVDSAKEYDDETVYFTKKQPIKNGTCIDLFKMDVRTADSEWLCQALDVVKKNYAGLIFGLLALVAAIVAIWAAYSSEGSALPLICVSGGLAVIFFILGRIFK